MDFSDSEDELYGENPDEIELEQGYDYDIRKKKPDSVKKNYIESIMNCSPSYLTKLYKLPNLETLSLGKYFHGLLQLWRYNRLHQSFS